MQIVNYALLKGIYLIKSHLDVAVHIAINGYNSTTLKQIVEKRVFKDVQCVSNCRRKLVLNGILIEKTKRNFEINPEIGIFSGNILFNLKLLYANQN